jgi:predicted Zn-dependent protease
MRDFFYALADHITRQTLPGEIFTCYFQGEGSDFIRINNTRIRQAGHVTQLELLLELIKGQRHVSVSLNLSGNLPHDHSLLCHWLETLRMQQSLVEDDPYLLYATEVHNTEEVRHNRLPDIHNAIAEVIDLADGIDLVGIWASGTQYRGFANSFGQRNWFSTSSFNFDWSCHLTGDRAVKSNYAGTEWDISLFEQKINDLKLQLKHMKRPTHRLSPGRYRTFLSPTALQEIMDMMAWDGFGIKSHRTLQTPLIKMIKENRRLHPSVTLYENHGAGLTPGFIPCGFIKPCKITLISKGHYQDCLVAPRSSAEYNMPVNAALEIPESLELSPGDISPNDVLNYLGTGLYVNNLWYCNFSDRNDCRITGMTRYGCFWVENGEITAPINVMRFDDNVYRMLGDHLVGLTQDQYLLIDPGTYHQRSTSSARLPGVLIEDFNLTL